VVFISITGGESKTLMLMNISPVEKNVSESCATLSFAQRVMSVELGPARKRTLAASVSVDRLQAKFSPVAKLH
jgi:hypothetical protein